MALKRITTKEGEVYFVDAQTGERVEPAAKGNPIGLIFKFIGVVVFVLSFCVVIVGAFIMEKEVPTFLNSGVVGAVSGLIFIGLGNIIDLLQSISNNTSKVNKLLEDLLKNKSS